ncbi:ATP-binding cassette domain-containing protein [Myxococcus sp. CA051A]|uniref:ATP-binding cassette domain-containing protein n=1 Tax=Myxococcus llanfairpwllgwyngyllgogerychwyrndrobwllllantysiliogogogochensis TaxID=2590453 RepID=A0A540WV43_9BACT|nr:MULTISPECIES: ATP-binding cassette domain-containing protein [Myxococcus]NTX00528.1 ATP-binding cassette domain-containing protein [Myxococcus sp. CA040A]NTX12769.1 ATP-binding cassette domain-containing protein [Myxococcus sp. CA056]NTX33788.1 ATP-binding cassette domain-containing protein [Myxococcus sp. CA033]NTX49841.1 ATP-binding cassette domain-containing protein [Myxococcus sp. CA039A]NTX59105.1 ATP-binding cassette domain-containing protein [Myxococcus sp. CA051A]
MIEAKNVTKRYGPTLVVDDVSLRFPVGGITSIIGPNGAGKSTLLSMISRVLPMSSGNVLVDGLDVVTTPGDELARRLAILRQDNHLTSRLTVRELVTFGRYPHSKGRPTVKDQEHVERAIQHMGLEALSARFLDELSGGQRQRAFVAMVLCQDTDYVLLDEPLNGLDLKHAVSMMKQLRTAANTLGKSFVLVLHDLNFASCYSDHLIAMRDGKVAFQGRSEDIMRPDVLRAVYDLEIAIQQINGDWIATHYR